MPFLNVGATTVGGALFPTKKALKDAMALDPSSVLFILTSPLAGELPVGSGRYCYGSDVTGLPASVKLSVVGPDPERSRKWYGTVEVKGGVVKVS